MIPQVIDVTDNALCVRRPSYLTCSYLIRRDTGIVLVDAGMKTDGSDILAGLAHWGCPVSSVRAILVTHWHNDHSAGAAEIEARSGCAVYYAEAEAPQLTRQTASTGVAGWLSDAIPEAGPLVLAKGLLGSAPMAAVEASAFLREGDTIEELVVLETPGHTAGHLPSGIRRSGCCSRVMHSRRSTESFASCRASSRRTSTPPVRRWPNAPG